MKIKKRIFLSIFTLSTLILAACGNSNDTEEQNSTNKEASNVEVATEDFPIVEEPIELSLMAPGVGMAEWDEMPTLKEYSEKTNINLVYETPPQADFSTRLNLAFASGDLPDIIYAGGPNSLDASLEADYGEQGLLIPLEDMLEDYAPNFYALMEENPKIRQSITTTDGHIYALPNVVENTTSSWIMGPLWYNGEWLDALDAEVPKTVDEFYELMVRFRDEDPNGNGEQDEIPISDVSMNGLRAWMMPAFGLKGWGIEEHNGKARYTFATENFRGYLEYFNKLFEEGLLDQETFSQSDEQKQAKGQNNQVGVFQEWFSYFVTGRSEEEAINDPMFAPLISDYQSEPLVPMDPGIKRGSFAITSENPNPEASLRWVDYFYSPEGYEYLLNGPEGYLWEWANGEEDGEKVYNEEVDADQHEKYRGTITPAYGITVPGLSIETPPIGGDKSEFQEFLRGQTEEKIEKHGEVIFPLTYLTKEEQDEVNDIVVDLETFVIENEAAFITGSKELNDENWEDYLQTLKGMGVERFEEIHQAAYDRWAETE